MGDRAVTKPGRKRDHTRDGPILDAALEVLAGSGYDGMTVDAVAARVGAARATVYRRWATKAELVLAAVERMIENDVDLDQLPDTGSLRGDMAGVIRPLSAEELELRMRVLAALTALSRAEPSLATAATQAGAGAWIEANRVLMQRAIDRGEFPPADLTTLSQVIPMIVLARATLHESVGHDSTLAIVDEVIIPALRGTR